MRCYLKSHSFHSSSSLYFPSLALFVFSFPSLSVSSHLLLLPFVFRPASSFFLSFPISLILTSFPSCHSSLFLSFCATPYSFFLFASSPPYPILQSPLSPIPKGYHSPPPLPLPHPIGDFFPLSFTFLYPTSSSSIPSSLLVPFPFLLFLPPLFRHVSFSPSLFYLLFLRFPFSHLPPTTSPSPIRFLLPSFLFLSLPFLSLTSFFHPSLLSSLLPSSSSLLPSSSFPPIPSPSCFPSPCSLTGSRSFGSLRFDLGDLRGWVKVRRRAVRRRGKREGREEAEGECRGDVGGKVGIRELEKGGGGRIRRKGEGQKDSG